MRKVEMRKIRLYSVMMVALVASLVAASIARAELVIDITQGNIEPMPIAVTDFYADNEATAKIGKQMADVIRADLERSGLFVNIDPRAYLQPPKDLQVTPVFANWRKIAAQALSTGLVRALGDGQINVQFRLWDVFAEQHLTGIQYTTPPSNWRRTGV